MGLRLRCDPTRTAAWPRFVPIRDLGISRPVSKKARRGMRMRWPAPYSHGTGHGHVAPLSFPRAGRLHGHGARRVVLHNESPRRATGGQSKRDPRAEDEAAASARRSVTGTEPGRRERDPASRRSLRCVPIMPAPGADAVLACQTMDPGFKNTPLASLSLSADQATSWSGS